MKKLSIAAVIAALAVAGCESESDGPTPAEDNNQGSVFYQELPDDGKVLCVWRIEYKAGGLSCDWAGSERANP